MGKHVTLEPWLGIHSEYSCAVIGCWLRKTWILEGLKTPEMAIMTRSILTSEFPIQVSWLSVVCRGSPHVFIGLKSTFRVQIPHLHLLLWEPPARAGRPIGERHRHLSKHFGGCAPAETAQGAYRSFKRDQWRPKPTKVG